MTTFFSRSGDQTCSKIRVQFNWGGGSKCSCPRWHRAGGKHIFFAPAEILEAPLAICANVSTGIATSEMSVLTLEIPDSTAHTVRAKMHTVTKQGRT